ncbi:glycosyltransferase [Sphingomonas sp. CA1-15]|uniref:Glycosyltransferase n=1 Tax=Sphingomonas immobilis TaxID=3063997 RepID=A0ABT9A755_9SPHN|nr:glycosyltransferase [Sphingomonas sp. CA1-15]
MGTLLVSLILFAFAAHPFFTYPLSLFFIGTKNRPVAASDPTFRPTLALCMSVFNESRVIVTKIENMLVMAERYGPATIHVYVDGATDDTPELLRAYADRIDLVVSNERKGKTAGLNVLVPRCESELIAFTDGNVITPATGLVDLAAHFLDKSVGCVTAKLVYTNEDESPTSAAGSLYWRLEEALKRVESATVGVMGVDGAFFMVRRALYQPAPSHLIDDLYVSLMILAAGHRVVTAEEVIVRERSAVYWREEYRRKRRIACQAWNVHRTLWPVLRKMPPMMRYAYVSHRLIKWLSPFLLALSGIAFAAAMVTRFGWGNSLVVLLVLSALFAIGVLLRLKPVTIALSAITSLAGVAAGVLEATFSRHTYTVWAPAASIRQTAD